MNTLGPVFLFGIWWRRETAILCKSCLTVPRVFGTFFKLWFSASLVSCNVDIKVSSELSKWINQWVYKKNEWFNHLLLQHNNTPTKTAKRSRKTTAAMMLNRCSLKWKIFSNSESIGYNIWLLIFCLVFNFLVRLSSI